MQWIVVTLGDGNDGYSIMVLQKAGGSFTTGDLQGAWNYHCIFTGDSPQFIGWVYSNISIDASGNVTFLSHIRSDGDTDPPSEPVIIAITSEGVVSLEHGGENTTLHGTMNVGKDLIVATLTTF